MTEYLVIDLATGDTYRSSGRDKDDALHKVIREHDMYDKWTTEGWVEGEGLFEGAGYDKFLVVPATYSKSYQATSKSFSRDGSGNINNSY